MKQKTFFVVFLMFPGILFSQISESKFDIQAGFSVPELLLAGLRFKVTDNTRLSFSVGSIPDSYYPAFNTYSITGGACFYFGKENNKQQSKRWAYNTGLSFYKDESKYYKWNYLYFNHSVSFDVYLSSSIIFQPEAGFTVELMKVEKEKPGAGQSWFSHIGPDWPVLPKPGIRFIYLF